MDRRKWFKNTGSQHHWNRYCCNQKWAGKERGRDTQCALIMTAHLEELCFHTIRWWAKSFSMRMKWNHYRFGGYHYPERRCERQRLRCGCSRFYWVHCQPITKHQTPPRVGALAASDMQCMKASSGKSFADRPLRNNRTDLIRFRLSRQSKANPKWHRVAFFLIVHARIEPATGFAASRDWHCWFGLWAIRPINGMAFRKTCSDQYGTGNMMSERWMKVGSSICSNSM